MKKDFIGPIGPLMKQYLELRRSVGFALRGDYEHVLGQFALYLAEHFPHAETITRSMVIGYLSSMKHLSVSTRSDYLSKLRQFCRFLHLYHPETYIPEKKLESRAKGMRTPYIYSREEVTRLMLAAMQLSPPGSLRPHTYATIIGLLWATGLRLKEALSLNLEDIDYNEGILHIRDSKFSKSRFVPLAGSTTNILHDYCCLRALYGHDQGPTAPFFINERDRRCTPSTVRHTFLELVRKLGMRTDQGGNPRLYDFRHTFATLTILEAYQSGKDPSACLPVLATYLGHVNIAHTEVYLHPLPDLLTIAGDRFYEHIHREGVIDQGGHDEKK